MQQPLKQQRCPKTHTKINFQVSESCVDDRWRKLESRDNVALWGSGRSSNLSRSRSMDFLPQRVSSGTKALCALFESKATLQQSFNSSPRLNSATATGSKTGRDRPLQDWSGHSTPLKATTTQVCEFSARVITLYITQREVSARFYYTD